MRHLIVASALFAACAPADPEGPLNTGWELVFEDEFDGEAGSPPDPDYWTHDVGGDGWGNEQLEYNTDSTNNVYQDGFGKLRIVAIEEEYEGNAYTSGRITTKGKVEFTYGRFEAEIRVPKGAGLWPAFWLLGADIDEVEWPACGEVDIMEVRGDEPNVMHGTLHGPGYSGGDSVGTSFTLPDGDFESDYHTFAVEIDPEFMAFYVDDYLYQRLAPGDLPGVSPWVYDGPKFMILNLAVGGNFLAPPDADTEFPAELRVRQVRVYERTGQ
jgi:beta-glucanase (GH16 family)